MAKQRISIFINHDWANRLPILSASIQAFGQWSANSVWQEKAAFSC